MSVENPVSSVWYPEIRFWLQKGGEELMRDTRIRISASIFTPTPALCGLNSAARIACRERIARLDTTIPELTVYRAQAKMGWRKDRQALPIA